MRNVLFAWAGRALRAWSLLVCVVTLVSQAVAAADYQPAEGFLLATNVEQVRRLAAEQRAPAYAFNLEGSVWWANARQGRLVLQDASGVEELELRWKGPAAKAGDRVRLSGHGTIARIGAGIRLGAQGAVVDNDGLHALLEKSGAVYLTRGMQPFRVEWFNGTDKYGLEIEYEGPGQPRQSIARSALFRDRVGAPAGTNSLESGLDYRCYEGPWEALPDFGRLTPVKTGTATHLDLEVLPRTEHVALVWEGCLQVPGEGLYTFLVKSDDGSRLFVGEPSFTLEPLGEATFPKPRPMAIGQALRPGEGGQWVEVEGTVTLARSQPGGMELELGAGAARLLVQVGDPSGLSASALLHRRVRAVGFCQSSSTVDRQVMPGVLLVPSGKEIAPVAEPAEPEAGTPAAGGLRVLTTAGEVHQLKREEAQRGYPVKLRGVVTCVLPEHQAFTLQDSTRGLYVQDPSSSRAFPPQVGEFLQVEGITDPSLFAPIVNASRVTSLGAGHLPQPVQPTWDQLLNGSLDAQLVEVEGIVTAVAESGVTLRTRGGNIQVELRTAAGAAPDEFKSRLNALVRIRGCLFASWDYVTHQVKVGQIRLYNADLLVQQAAPADLFSSPAKTAADLLLFDPQASVFQRVKVSGQLLHIRDGEAFLADGAHGLRFNAKDPGGLEVGDRVEVVGFPELSGSASPVLQEAVARKTGHAPLPEPRKLPAAELLRAEHDATRVQVDGLLVGQRRDGDELVLELQNGVRTFAARLPGKQVSPGALPVGGRLQLTGVYAGQGGNRATGQDVASFELLLNSPSEVRVLSRPPWWTLERLLIIVGVLASVLAGAMLWLTQLRRQVAERTAQLGAQIQERQRAEHQRALEQERARIARDLHDELGSSITEITMLAARAKGAAAPDEKRNRYLEQMGDKAREMVSALDEIVWAMNPRHDSLASLISYFSLYADRFLGLANIQWRLETPAGRADVVLSSRHRHQLFLAFKEALTNVVRHSGATEVRVAIEAADGFVRLRLADNGRGLVPGATQEGMDGIANMRARLEKLGGRLEVSTEPGRGAVLEFHAPAA